MKHIALTLSKNIYEYSIKSLHKNVTLVFCASEIAQSRGFFPSYNNIKYNFFHILLTKK